MMFKKNMITRSLAALGLVAMSGMTYGATFVIEKNGTGFSIDGNGGARLGQQVYLWQTNLTNTNQTWDQLTRGDNTVAFRKENTDLCWDGGNGGERLQAVTLQTCDEDNQNQHWRKIKVISGTEIYRLEKRNAPCFSIDGSGRNELLQEFYL